MACVSVYDNSEGCSQLLQLPDTAPKFICEYLVQAHIARGTSSSGRDRCSGERHWIRSTSESHHDVNLMVSTFARGNEGKPMQVTHEETIPQADSMKPVRVVVVDDQLLLREGIARILQSDPRIQVAALGANGQEAIDLVDSIEPDVVLMDIRMPVTDGIQATRQIKARHPNVRVIILTSFVYDGYIVEGFMANADGYLLKDTSSEALTSSVLTVATGQRVIEPSVGRHVGEMLGKQSAERKNAYDGLTERQLQMLAMIGRGLIAKEIAHELHISEKTVRNHVTKIYQKLNISDRSQAVLYAIRKGLVSPE